MRRLRIPVGSLLGVQLWLHASWFLVFGLVTWVTVATFGEVYPELGAVAHALMGLATGLLFFACLTAHELAHAVVARRFGVEVRGITLFMFGGVAEIRGELPSPAREFAVALIGPATSVSLGGVFALAGIAGTEAHAPVVEGIATTLAVVNLGVALFNLIPGLPLDGGRLLRAAIWRLTGDHRRATRVAAVGGRVVALLLAALGVAIVLSGDPFGLWYVPMAVFVWLLARTAGRPSPVPPAPTGALAWETDEGATPQPRP